MAPDAPSILFTGFEPSGDDHASAVIRELKAAHPSFPPLQGTAADIIKRAMMRLPGALAEAGLKTRMLLQVHDELIFEAPVDEAEQALALIRKIMSKSATLDVPLEVEANQAESWASAH